ncbi:DNA primase, partial [bacterium]
MLDKLDLIELLDYIDPSALDYSEWVNVGMALKHEGHSVSVWDRWSSRDSGRYRRGECEKKWDGFRGTSTPVTGGTIVQLAKENGWSFAHDDGHELGWDDEIRDELVIVDKNWVEGAEVHSPSDWSPAKELIKYLETLFEASENVGYVVSTWEKDGK